MIPELNKAEGGNSLPSGYQLRNVKAEKLFGF